MKNRVMILMILNSLHMGPRLLWYSSVLPEGKPNLARTHLRGCYSLLALPRQATGVCTHGCLCLCVSLSVCVCVLCHGFFRAWLESSVP